MNDVSKQSFVYTNYCSKFKHELQTINMNWILIAEIAYACILILVCIKIIYDTENTTKTLAYILFAIFVPVVGIFFYFSFGINYRKRTIYSKSLFDEAFEVDLMSQLKDSQNQIFKEFNPLFPKYSRLSKLVLNQKFFPLTKNNSVHLLKNGEEKFPEVIQAIKNAKNHIHLEYYIFENDKIGNLIIDLLIQKAENGLKVRFIYDDFGSRGIKNKQLKKMRAAGVDVYPFYKIKIIALANRLNYRNHRKIIVIDGEIGFVGGINVCEKYINNQDNNKLYWRDTHLKIIGPAVMNLQYIFLVDWNYCSKEKIQPNSDYFPSMDYLGSENQTESDNKVVQIVASGPDSKAPLILQSICKAITTAQNEILITTPYFIPSDSLSDSLIIAATSGVKTKLLVPKVSDSKFVNFASRSYFTKLLKSGVEIYRYEKGFVHSKTMVIDNEISIIGTANMDMRSFDLNFEVNAIVYDKEISNELRGYFYEDLKDSSQIDKIRWQNRSKYIKLAEKISGLFSPLL